MKLSPQHRLLRAAWSALLCLGLVSFSACSLTAAQPASHSAAAPTSAMPTTAPTAAATATPTPVWSTYSDLKDGFQIAIPSVLGFNGPPSVSGTSTDPYSLSFGRNADSPVPVTPATQRFAEVQIGILVSHRAIGSCGIGTSVPVGAFSGYQSDNFAYVSTPTPAGTPAPQLSVELVANGLYYQISMTGPHPNSADGPFSRDAFMQHYGDIWAHLLASFRPGPMVSGPAPCA